MLPLEMGEARGRNSVNESFSFSFQGYNIHINGSFHCCLRYKQLHSLHEQLKRSLPSLVLPSFPPKKLLPLTNSQLESRRASLERYIQLRKFSIRQPLKLPTHSLVYRHHRCMPWLGTIFLFNYHYLQPLHLYTSLIRLPVFKEQFYFPLFSVLPSSDLTLIRFG